MKKQCLLSALSLKLTVWLPGKKDSSSFQNIQSWIFVSYLADILLHCINFSKSCTCNHDQNNYCLLQNYVILYGGKTVNILLQKFTRGTKDKRGSFHTLSKAFGESDFFGKLPCNLDIFLN